MRLPKAERHKKPIAIIIALFLALTLIQCIFVVGASAYAQEKPYEELISDYYTFIRPTHIAAYDDVVAVFDSGEIVLFRGQERSIFSVDVEECDKICVTEDVVILLSGAGEDEESEVRIYSTQGELREPVLSGEDIIDISVCGDSLYALSSLTVVQEYALSDGALKDTFTLPRKKYALYLSAKETDLYFLSVLGSVFKKSGSEYSATIGEVGRDVLNIAAADEGLFYEADDSIFLLGEEEPFLKTGDGDDAFASVTDFAVANGLLYVLDGNNLAVKAFDLETREFVKMIGSYGTDIRRLNAPVALSVSGGKIVVADKLRGSVFSAQGVDTLKSYRITEPTDVAIAGSKIYLAEKGLVHEYNSGLIRTTEYRVGEGNTKYVVTTADGSIYADSDGKIYCKKEGTTTFSEFLQIEGSVDGLGVGIGGKILYVLSGGSLAAYSSEGVLLGTLDTTENILSFAVDYRGNVYCLTKDGRFLRYARTVGGYASAVEYSLAEGYRHFVDLALDADGKIYLIADHNILIYPKSAFDVFLADDSTFTDEVATASPRFVCEVVRSGAVLYTTPDDFEEITPIAVGTKLMCYATVRYAGDDYLRVETERGTAYLPKADVKLFSTDGSAPLTRARCLIPAVGTIIVGVDLYEEPSYLSIKSGKEPLFKGLGEEEVFEVISYAAVDETGKDVWGFYRVEYRGQTAYVLVDEVVSVDDEPLPMPPRYAMRVKSDGLGKTVPLYSEASVDSEEVVRLTDGTTLYALEPLDTEKEFTQVLYGGEVCYVLSAYLGQGGLSGGQILAIVLSVAAVVGSVLTILILRASKKHKRYHKE